MKLRDVTIAFVLLMCCVVGAGYYFSPARQIRSAIDSIPIYDEEGEFYRRNPFEEDTKMTPGAKAAIKKELHEFGRLALGETGTHGFVIKNEGTEPLRLAKGRSQCKCTLANLDDPEIPPGGEAVINLEWTPKDKGPFSQEAIIWTSDPEKPEIHLAVRGNMFDKLVVYPENSWSLGTVKTDSVAFEGYVFTQILDDLKILSVEPSSDRLQFSFEAVPPEDMPEPDATAAYRISGTLTPPEEAQAFKGHVVIKTNQEGEQAEIRLGVLATRLGPLTLVGPGWHADSSIFVLDRVSAERGKTFRYALILDEQIPDFEITEVTCEPGFLDVSLSNSSSDEGTARYTLAIKVPPKSPTGVWTVAKPGLIVVKTNHPKLPELEFKVALDAY
ncbi:MAG: DUF1573 domain-containing protein [Planctomycetaceae bacterium]